MKRFHLTLTLAFFLTLATAAEARRTCRILFLGTPAGAPKELVLFDGKVFQKVEMPDMNLSPVYQIDAESLGLRLLDKEPSSSEEIPAAAPGMKLGKDVTDFYLIINHDAGNAYLPFAMQVINADFGRFAKGEMLWLNLTEKQIGGTLGTRKLALKPKSQMISKAPADEPGAYPVALYSQSPGDKDVWPVCETSWSHNPTGRIVMFVLPEQGGRVPRIMGFPDFRAEKEQQKDSSP